MDYENLTPQYRIEEYLEAIVEGWAEATVVAYPEVPSWRIEEFLDAFITYIWEDGDHPRHPCPEPVWHIEECLRAIYDVMTGAATPWPFPTPTNRIEEYLAAIHAYLADNTELPVPEPVWRIEQWLAYALDAVKQGGGIEKTVSGTMVHITDALAKAALSVLASIEPIQDLHGYATPWPAGGGKNKYKTTLENQTKNQVTATVDGDGFIHLSGTASATTIFSLGGFTFSAGEYYITMCPAGGSSTTYRVYASWGSNDTGNGWTRTFTEGEERNFQLNISSGTNVDGLVCKPMICLSSAGTDFAPYENTCPISGLTGLSVYRTGKNLLDNANPSVQAGSNIAWGSSSVSGAADGSFVLPAGTYTVSASETMTGIYVTDSNGTAIKNAYNKTVSTFTISEFKAVKIMFYKSGTTDMSQYQYQLELGSTATTYEPYNGNTYSVDWSTQAGTVYGGTVDPVAGQLTVDWIYKEFDGTEAWNATAGYCSLFGQQPSKSNTDMSQKSNVFVAGGNGYAEYNKFRAQTNGAVVVGNKKEDGTTGRWADAAAFKSFLAGLYSAGTPFAVCYELATPLTYQLSAQEVQMLLGENYVWSSSGDTVSVTYYAEGNANPLQSLNILLGGNYSNQKTADDVSDKEALEIILGGNK